MTVKKIGDDESAKKRVTCKHCGSILEYLPRDVVHVVHTDYGGGSDTYSHIKCPECHCNVQVKT